MSEGIYRIGVDGDGELWRLSAKNVEDLMIEDVSTDEAMTCLAIDIIVGDEHIQFYIEAPEGMDVRFLGPPYPKFHLGKNSDTEEGPGEEVDVDGKQVRNAPSA